MCKITHVSCFVYVLFYQTIIAIYNVYQMVHHFFTVEAKGIDLALEFNRTCDKNKFIIFSESLSVLKAMNYTRSKNPKIHKRLEKCHEIL